MRCCTGVVGAHASTGSVLQVGCVCLLLLGVVPSLSFVMRRRALPAVLIISCCVLRGRLLLLAAAGWVVQSLWEWLALLSSERGRLDTVACSHGKAWRNLWRQIWWLFQDYILVLLWMGPVRAIWHALAT
jgi:hypothetical protein